MSSTKSEIWRESESEYGAYHILIAPGFEAVVQSIAGEWGFTIWETDPDIGSICVYGERSAMWSERTAIDRAKAHNPYGRKANK